MLRGLSPDGISGEEEGTLLVVLKFLLKIGFPCGDNLPVKGSGSRQETNYGRLATKDLPLYILGTARRIDASWHKEFERMRLVDCWMLCGLLMAFIFGWYLLLLPTPVGWW